VPIEAIATLDNYLAIIALKLKHHMLRATGLKKAH
jgi:hypothetical protein